jgi:molybdenum cofactor biosynthesis enzyme MoaA
MTHPRVQLRSLDTLWFQVGGTVCNLACSHCLVSASPTNRTHETMSLEQVRPFLAEGARLGVREYYFTGGEPFLNAEMERILEATLELGPATVLTNGLLLDPDRCARLKEIEDGSDYSLDLRVSLDGYDAATNDPIRGTGTFDRVLRGLHNLVAAGLSTVITVTQARCDVATGEGRRKFIELLAEVGIDKPRLKILPVFRIGAEVERSGAYESWQQLAVVDTPESGWDHLQCSTCRIVTDQGVWVCPILVNEPEARMGERLADTLDPFSLRYQACWTCHVQGATCRT